jgi:hypothetical protein
MGAVYTPETRNWRFYNDTAAEVGDSQAMEAENTSPTLPDNTSIVRMRIQITDTGGKKGTKTFSLEYSENGGTWTALGSANHFDYADGQGTVGNDITTWDLTSSDQYGEWHEDAAGIDTVDASATLEQDWAIVPTGTVTADESYAFRTVESGTPTPVGSGYSEPSVTTAAAAADDTIAQASGIFRFIKSRLFGRVN